MAWIARLRTRINLSNLNIINLLVLSLLTTISIYLIVNVYRLGYFPNDWYQTYAPAARLFITGKSPYSIGDFFNAPWILIPITPFAIVPDKLLGYILFVIFNLVSIIVVAVKRGIRLLWLPFLLLSYPVVVIFLYGQIEGLVLLGLILPPQWGIMFLVTKPQIGLGVIAYYLYDAYRKGGYRSVIKLCIPTSLAFLLSFVFYGFWLIHGSIQIPQWWNVSLWPWSIPFGFATLIFALLRDRKDAAILSSPLLSPYLGAQSWVVAFLSLDRYPLLLVIGSLLTWLFLRPK